LLDYGLSDIKLFLNFKTPRSL